jgi:Na+/H+ antiporter NhaD/arsenite permease-like protein
MLTILIVVFVLAYAAIALEHPLGISKSASALVGAGLLWTIYALSSGNAAEVSDQIAESANATARIVFFLLGAMTIVELMDAHGGFEVVTKRIHAASLPSLIWIVGFVTFFLSAILDNLTTTIVMVSLMRKLLARQDERLLVASLIVIAANSGGAWSPIGDVTTTMLWIGGQISALAIVKSVFLPALASFIVPASLAAYSARGRTVVCDGRLHRDHATGATPFDRNVIFFAGLAILVAVPAFKVVTGLPPFLGVLFGMGILWVTGDVIHRSKPDQLRGPFTLAHALSRIDMSSIVFFIGILLAVAVLEHTHVLASLAQGLSQVIARQEIIVLVIGVASAIVDNVPLVAATMGMYSLADYPVDHFLWQFLAYCAGTGGSILIIGSAAGVAAMGIEKIDFVWYLRKISGLAVLGYFAGAGVYLVQHHLM